MFGLKKGLTAFPRVKVVGIDQIEVLVVLKMNRQPFVLDWSGCRTMLGLNKADASNEYSWLRGSCCIELKNSADDMVGPSLIGWVEVSGFSRRFEGSDDNPGRIRAQI